MLMVCICGRHNADPIVEEPQQPLYLQYHLLTTCSTTRCSTNVGSGRPCEYLHLDITLKTYSQTEAYYPPSERPSSLNMLIDIYIYLTALH